MSNLSVNPNEVLSPVDIETLRNSKFRGFSDKEIAYCAKVVGLLNLNPFLNQIHFMRRVMKDGTASVVTIIGIDGLRLSAQRTSGYAGSDEPVFEYDARDEARELPTKATVTVYRIVQGTRCPFTASARWKEYCPDDMKSAFIWKKMPHGQLAKCAEALALRKAFPAELASVYAEEEMQQAEKGGVYPENPPLTDGSQIPDPVYRIPGGTYVKRGFHEIDPRELGDYITRREELLKKHPEKKPLWWDEFASKAEKYLGDLERGTIEVEEPVF